MPEIGNGHEIAFGRMYVTNELVKLVKKIESGQMVEVVRCRDCIRRYDTDECPMCFLNGGLYVECTEDDGFCDLGERKGGDGNDRT